MASATRWICLYCGEKGQNIEYLDESFKKNSKASDGENGEMWIGCMTCEQSFHVRCMLLNAVATQPDMEEKVKEHVETVINK